MSAGFPFLAPTWHQIFLNIHHPLLGRVGSLCTPSARTSKIDVSGDEKPGLLLAVHQTHVAPV